MCNRYRMTAKQAELAKRFGIEAPYPEDVTIPPPELFRSGWAGSYGKRAAGAS